MGIGIKIKTFVKDFLARRVVAPLLPKLCGEKKYFEMFRRHGVHVLPVHFYSPVPDVDELPADFWQKESKMGAIELNEPKQLEFMEQIQADFREELEKIPLDKTETDTEYYFRHGEFSVVDAEVLYCILRARKPARFLEVGSGFSTCLAARALALNAEGGSPCRQMLIDPYPREMIKSGKLNIAEIMQKRVQDIPLEKFKSLEKGDILFIDSSHVLKTGSDVQYELLEILPSLKSGVIVHFHDIFWPKEYPEEWLKERRTFWNEQYALQAFLAFNNSFRILWTGHYMNVQHPNEIRRTFPATAHIPPCPGSVWLEKVDSSNRPATGGIKAEHV